MRCLVLMLVVCVPLSAVSAEQLKLTLRRQIQADRGSGNWETTSVHEEWKPEETAIIVCDVWDLHHCLNAVRRLEQFAPRLNQVLATARDRGAVVIHSPSDCMAAYADHPARQRATSAPSARYEPPDVRSWCSQIPSEERAHYPIDQSDGGEDDDPEEHQQWVARLRDLGRDPGTPWKKQNKLITIDPDRDYISDRGDEVWNILEHHGVRNVILTGVHLNMCVLGRPFGLRQMARNGRNVVLMRDMTDTMYNPELWPFVSHERGTELMVRHVERYVCPTITSDQFLGGQPFRIQPVRRTDSTARKTIAAADPRTHWVTVTVPASDGSSSDSAPRWLRCVVRMPERWKSGRVMLASVSSSAGVWLNGHKLQPGPGGLVMPGSTIEFGDANLLAIRCGESQHLDTAPVIRAGDESLVLAGRWQLRVGDDETFANMPLPAKFGGAADIVFRPHDPVYVARPLTPAGGFTPGIEGPACDSEGHIFAVNYGSQGTIGRVSPTGVAEVFVTLPEGSVGNGIRFDRDGSFFVADYTGHNVLKVDPVSRSVTVHSHEPRMNQPNDLAMGPDGMLYASDPDWKNGSGQVWLIDTEGKATLLASDMGTTNGIEVSPDGRTLYVNESQQRRIWAFDLLKSGRLGEKRLLREFPDHGFDGMRCDVDGNLYVTRYGKGTVVKLSPDGGTLREIVLPGKRPSNICFGGPDGCTAFVTEVDNQQLVSFRVERPGMAWVRNQLGQGERLDDGSRLPLLVAHRGASHDAPENTLAAFRLAFERNADGVEGDFFLTRDGQIVCTHDKETKRFSEVNLKVADATLAELRELDVGAWKDPLFRGERMPSFAQVAAIVPPHRMFFIELKTGPEIVQPLKRALEQSRLRPEQCVIICFNARTIAEARRLLPAIKAHWLTGHDQKGDPPSWQPTVTTVAETLRRSNASGLGSEAEMEAFTADYIQALRGRGLAEFHVWTVNDPKTARHYRELGAIGITTDRPGYLRRELRPAESAGQPSGGSGRN